MWESTYISTWAKGNSPGARLFRLREIDYFLTNDGKVVGGRTKKKKKDRRRKRCTQKEFPEGPSSNRIRGGAQDRLRCEQAFCLDKKENEGQRIHKSFGGREGRGDHVRQGARDLQERGGEEDQKTFFQGLLKKGWKRGRGNEGGSKDSKRGGKGRSG